VLRGEKSPTLKEKDRCGKGKESPKECFGGADENHGKMPLIESRFVLGKGGHPNDKLAEGLKRLVRKPTGLGEYGNWGFNPIQPFCSVAASAKSTKKTEERTL